MDKIKILFFAANPTMTQLALEEETREITQKIRMAEHRDALELISAWSVRPDDLFFSLNSHNPQIVHFSTHGSPSGGLWLNEAQKSATIASTNALVSLFTSFKGNIRLVFLNACRTQRSAKALAKIVDCVIGMRDEIGDEAAILFSSTFYSAIGFGKSVKEAFEQAKARLLFTQMPEDKIPVLHMKAGVDPAQVFLLQPELPGNVIRIFYSYAQEDKEQCRDLDKHLVLLRHQGKISTWYDERAGAGVDIKAETRRQLEAAHIILLLISIDYMNTAVLYEEQMKRALQRRQRERKFCVIPILLRPAENWEETEFGDLQPLPHNRKPVSTWENADSAYADIARGIRKVVNEFLQQPQA